ncbi:MAG TPA: outer membrane beta-barrel protein [Bacteroidota bacterium]|nr:outer membrane beta-barrel protein [Bacteroidota bacterium]
MQRLRFLTALLLFLTVAITTLPARAAGDGPDRYRITSLWNDAGGGNVLRPGREGDYHWFIGLDAGLTWSSFSNGPLSYFFMPGPYNPRHPLVGAVDEGNGIGLYVGATLDFPLSDIFGIVLKGNYHTRVGSFDLTSEFDFFNGNSGQVETAVVNSKTDWTFNYIGVDLLLRVNLGELPVYLLAGPSFGFLQSNKAKLDQTVLSPDDLFYVEDLNGTDAIINNHRTASMEAEIEGFKDSRIDLKVGAGWWIELNKDLYLTPEVSVAIPMTDLVDSVSLDSTEPGKDYNMLTAFFTIGLRWRM